MHAAGKGWRGWTGLLALLLAGCGEQPATGGDKAYAPDSGWATFWGAFIDEAAGEPSAEALKPLARFDEAGLRFDFPSVLRVNHDAEEQEWRLWRGDFELQVQVRNSYDADYARTLLELMQDMLHSERAGPAESVTADQVVRWCGRDITAQRMRMTFLGDSHEFLAFDVPVADGGSRLLLFDDLQEDNKRSRTAEAVLAAVSTSLDCTAVQQNPL